MSFGAAVRTRLQLAVETRQVCLGGRCAAVGYDDVPISPCFCLFYPPKSFGTVCQSVLSSSIHVADGWRPLRGSSFKTLRRSLPKRVLGIQDIVLNSCMILLCLRVCMPHNVMPLALENTAHSCLARLGSRGCMGGVRIRVRRLPSLGGRLT